ncbi:hypothetical protein CAC42_2891 [Sphaceloma murrayae]|uniref:Uncharacterized protein n=1 Tax=Sphaceloma murrayae TaxID=2082308 RepID=A0A2K1R043_9PEZI|nr:hypothetical protein CAC42_2891 [Sphaceloma murrayae]
MTSTHHHRGSVPFLHRTGSISRTDVGDAMFSPQSTNFIAKLRARKQSNARDSITPTEAVWFLSLPDKVKRQHFTKEEQILIRARSELALLDASPETLTHIEDAHPRPHVRTKSIAQDSTASTSPLPSPSLMPRVSSLDNRHSVYSVAASSVRSRSTQWLASPESVQEVFPKHLQPQLQPPQQTFLRSPTIKFSSWDKGATHSPSMDTVRPTTSRSMSQTSMRAQPPPPLNIQQKPLYLKDPSTKALLKDCVGKGRFEETLIFGFPAPANLRPQPILYDAVSPGTQIRETWLDSSVYADEDDQDREELSSADEIEPATPNSFVQPQIVESESDYFPVSENGLAPSPTILRNPSNTSYFEELMKRDMTLRMTLTKPELRASEEELYGWQDESNSSEDFSDSEKDPLALAKLTFSDDVTGLNGAFAQTLARKKGIKAFWFRK